MAVRSQEVKTEWIRAKYDMRLFTNPPEGWIEVKEKKARERFRSFDWLSYPSFVRSMRLRFFDPLCPPG